MEVGFWRGGGSGGEGVVLSLFLRVTKKAQLSNCGFMIFVTLVFVLFRFFVSLVFCFGFFFFFFSFVGIIDDEMKTKSCS